MAFRKTGEAVTTPQEVKPLLPQVGEEGEDGLVWDGREWVQKEPQTALPSELPEVPVQGLID